MRLLRAAALAAALLVPAASAGAQAVKPPVAADYVASPNVEYLGHIAFDAGQTTGARIVGDKLYVTSAKNISIYDIKDPANPQLIGLFKLNLAWENEEVPTNGKILGVSSDFFSATPSCNVPSPQVTNCQQLFDVRDPSNIKELPALPQSGDHTAECVLDCRYLFGSGGTITDLGGVLDGAQPKVLGDWQARIKSQLADRGYPKGATQCHHVREIKPGYLFAACEPFVYFRVVEGGSVERPEVLVTGANADNRLVHSVRWPREAQDKFALVGGETNFTGGRCDGTTDGAFMVFDASRAGETGRFGDKPLDEYRPRTGRYLDGNGAVEVTGCSVHWFMEHPSFRDGGLVALAAYDNGTRFLQVKSDGTIVEQGYFQPLGLETSSPKWVPGTDIVYSIDYSRGIDILRWKGKHYVPGAASDPGMEGTEGKYPTIGPLTARQQALAVQQVSLLRAQGWFPDYGKLVSGR